MHVPFRYRLSLTERCFWLLLVLLSMLAFSGRAQARRAGPHTGSRALRPGGTGGDEFVRNYGTGLRLGSELAALRSGRMFSTLEVGAYHQHALGAVGSVQVEAVYFRQPATATEAAARGLRLPVLLVLNPFDNVGLHLGPQLRWQPTAARPVEGGIRPPTALTAEFVFGAEARVNRGRVGARYGFPLALLTDLPAVGDRFGGAWQAGQLQVYLGVDIFLRSGSGF